MHMSMEIVWHDFDRARRILRVAFVSEDRIMGIKYQLCPKCGVTMAEEGHPLRESLQLRRLRGGDSGSLGPSPPRQTQPSTGLQFRQGWYEDNSSLVPSVAALVRLSVNPGTRGPTATPSRVDVDLFT